MFARLLVILVCILGAVSRPGLAESLNSPHRRLVVYLKTVPGQPPAPADEMKREVDTLMGGAGYSILWRSSADYGHDEGNPAVVLSELHGVCEAPPSGITLDPPEAEAPLASTAVSDGEVLPFIRVDCDNLTRLLTPALPSEWPARRNYLYGRALGRVVAHELFHVLTGTLDHDDTGVAKRSFRARDILAEHFEFELATLKRLSESGAGGVGANDGNLDSGTGGR